VMMAGYEEDPSIKSIPVSYGRHKNRNRHQKN